MSCVLCHVPYALCCPQYALHAAHHHILHPPPSTCTCPLTSPHPHAAGKSPFKSTLPAPTDLARKYGVDGDDDEGGGGDRGSDRGLSLDQQMEFMQKQQQLVQKVESKNIEIDRLCTLLEGVSTGRAGGQVCAPQSPFPVPGY